MNGAVTRGVDSGPHEMKKTITNIVLMVCREAAGKDSLTGEIKGL